MRHHHWSNSAARIDCCFADSRLVEITQLFLNPPAVEEPAVEEPVVEESFEVVEIPVVALPSAVPAGGSFHFMQEDELAQTEPEPEPEVTPEEAVEESTTVEVVDTVVETEVNGHAVVEETVTVTTTTEV